MTARFFKLTDRIVPAINLDAEDPVFAAQLRQLGAVQPHPHFSNSSTAPFDPHPMMQTQTPAAPDPRSNPALQILAARQKLQEEAEEEIQNGGPGGRKFIDATNIRQALLLRDQHGLSAEKIEERLGMKKGSMAKLGGKGVVEGI